MTATAFGALQMKHFNTLWQNIIDWHIGNQSNFKINGVDSAQWNYLLSHFLESGAAPFIDHNLLILCLDEESVENEYSNWKSRCSSHEVLQFPGLELSPYSGALASENSLLRRFYALDRIAHTQNKKIIFTTLEALLLKIPPHDFFMSNRINLEISDIVSPYELASRLVAQGYTHATSVEEAGSFSQKGEIFDIYPISGAPIRIHYFDDMIETIHEIELGSQKTKKIAPWKNYL